jgi:hypothetical protein
MASSTMAQQLPWFPFTWTGSSMNNKYYGKNAMVLPLGASGGNREIYSIQIDTGCEGTFYTDQKYMDTNHLKSEYLNNFMRNQMFASTIHTFFIDIDKKLRKQFICDSLVSRRVNHYQVGVMGSDVLKNKILIIDFPNTRMCIVDSVDSPYRMKFDMVEMKIIHSWPVIPVQINGDKKWMMFDTGSSNYELITTKSNWDLLVDKKMVVNTVGPANSWGTPVYMYGRPLKNGCKIGTTSFNKCQIWYTNPDRIEKLIKENNLFGITGNAMYLNKTVMLDYKNKRFGITK